MTTIVVETGLPHKHLSPNARVHWRSRARAKKAARTAAHFAALDACRGNPPRWEKATVQATFFFKDRRGLKSDEDNLISSAKAILDGIADAGIIGNDRGLTWLTPPVIREVDPIRPRVELAFTESKA